MEKFVTQEKVKQVMKDGLWANRQEIRQGYAIFEDSRLPETSEIQRLDCVMLFKNDYEASLQAEKDGIKIIRDMLPEDDEEFAFYIDTPKNRKIIQKYMLNELYNYTLLDNLADEQKDRYIAIYEALIKHNIEIPFGVEI